MIKSSTLILGLMTSALIAGVSGVGLADMAAAPKVAGPVKAADKDFGRLSAVGVSAFNDIHMARRAIFDGKTDEAASLIADAQASLAKAKADDAIFMKAESALRGPAQTTAKANTGKSVAPIAWIPIDSEIALGDTFESTPEKAAAVVTARKNLEKGENAKSLEAIKLAQIDINFTVAVAPLEQSIADIDQANSLVAKHDYYGASQALKMAEDGIRYDEIDDVAQVRGQATAANAKNK